MPSKKEELLKNMIDIYYQIKQLDKEDLNRDDIASNKLATYLYTPHKKLPEYLETFKQHLQILNPNSTQLQERGKLLEQIVYLIFCGLKGATSFKSYQSAGPQYDLLVTGDNEERISVS